MSYTIFRKIKVNKDGTILCNSSDNNICPHYWHDWTCDYFKTWKNFSVKAIKNWLILAGLYAGDKYYMKSWKDRQKLAWKFVKQYGEKKFFDELHENGYAEPSRENLALLNKFIKFMEDSGKEVRYFKVQRRADGCWGLKMSNRHFWFTPYFSEAKIFKMDDLDRLEDFGAERYITIEVDKKGDLLK